MSQEIFNISEILSKHLQGRCSDVELSYLNRWLDSDKRNAELLQKLLDSKHLKRELTTLNRFDQHHAWVKINMQTDTKESRLPKKVVRIWASIAAAMVVLVGFGLLFLSQQKEDEMPQTRVVVSHNPKYKNDVLPAIEGATLVLANGEKINLSDEITVEENGMVRSASNDLVVDLKQKEEIVYHELVVPKTHFFSFKLSDGSKVWINANSKLRFPASFSGAERKIYLLEGEAYFEVAKNDSKPFIVETEQAKVKVLGTHFNVSNYKNSFSTTLAEGKVEVYNNQDLRVLEPKQKAYLHKGKFSTKTADLTKDLAWKNNIFFFKNENLKNIMQQIENWYGVSVVVRGQVDASATYSGEINRDVPLSDILDMLELASGLEFSVENTKLFVESKN